jgi:hypothetical protein
MRRLLARFGAGGTVDREAIYREAWLLYYTPEHMVVRAIARSSIVYYE